MPDRACELRAAAEALLRTLSQQGADDSDFGLIPEAIEAYDALADALGMPQWHLRFDGA